MTEYFILSAKHTGKRDPYITFWRPNDAGYAWPLEWSGRYPAEQIRAASDYYNDGVDTYAVPVSLVMGFAKEAVIDGQRVRAVKNNKQTFRQLIAASEAP